MNFDCIFYVPSFSTTEIYRRLEMVFGTMETFQDSHHFQSFLNQFVKLATLNCYIIIDWPLKICLFLKKKN